MTDLIIPQHISPTEVEWTLVDFSSVFPSTFGGTPKVVDRGQRWQAVLRFQNLTGAARADMQAFLASCRGRANRVWFGDVSNPIRGAFPCAEMFSNADFSAGATGWTAPNAVLLARQGRAKIIAATLTPNVEIYQPVTIVGGATYLCRSLLLDGKGTAGLSIGVAIADGLGTSYTYSNARSLVSVTRTPVSSGSVNASPAVIASTSGYAVGAFFTASYASFQRCALVTVSGASPAGGACTIRGLPVSTAGLALAGDMVEIAGELKRLIADVDSDGTGSAYIQFEPSLRSSAIVDGAPVVFGAPLGKFMLSADATWPTRPGKFSDFSLTFAEA